MKYIYISYSLSSQCAVNVRSFSNFVSQCAHNVTERAFFAHCFSTGYDISNDKNCTTDIIEPHLTVYICKVVNYNINRTSERTEKMDEQLIIAFSSLTIEEQRIILDFLEPLFASDEAETFSAPSSF